MTWLDENDESIIELNRLGLLYSFRTKEAERMARVLRELARLANILNVLTPVPQIDFQKAVDLSDDAKELLAGHHS